jgi:hypothetical protein
MSQINDSTRPEIVSKKDQIDIIHLRNAYEKILRTRLSTQLSSSDDDDDIDLLNLESRVFKLISDFADQKIILPILIADSEALGANIKNRTGRLEDDVQGLVDEISRMQVVNIACCGEETRVDGHLRSVSIFLETLKVWNETKELDMVILISYL